MQVVAIPFLDEDARLVRRNLEIAASHPAIDRVWGISGRARPDLGVGTSSGIEIIPQTRFGSLRPGKGDAMNTALHRAAGNGVERLHFYDADITNFDRSWIDGAEHGADLGFDVVRHTFPRAATDAMITWMITKPLFALRFPETVLPRIGQPLGGELLLSRPAIEAMADNELVRGRSDWGIDTVLTYTGVASGLSLYEHHVSSGKRHSLYGSLAELRTMVVECFDAVIRLPDGAVPAIEHHAEPPEPAPDDLRSAVGYSVEKTLPLATRAWEAGEREFAEQVLPDAIHTDLLGLVGSGDFSFLDERAWHSALTALGAAWIDGGPGVRAVLFRLWVGRVLNYTTTQVPQGYEHALDYLENTIVAYRHRALTG